MPTAYIATNRNRLKVYNLQSVYLKGGQEFQIELFNPLQETVAAKIYLNGKSISNSMIVLKPGERSFLERFIDDNKKFKFDTYEVENSSEAKKAIEKNGLVRVEFYKENTPAPIINFPYQPYVNNYYYSTPYYYGGTTLTGTGLGLTGSSTTISASSTSSNVSYTANANNSSSTSSNVSYMANANNSAFNCCDMSASLSDSVETGRVEAGNSSSQSFGTYCGTFQSLVCTYVEYHIMPESHKPVEVNKIRNYCSGCGNRIRKSSWKFCPGCGNSID